MKPMLSKMMLPDAARRYERSNNKATSETSKENSSAIPNEKSASPPNDKVEKGKTANKSNWEKYKNILAPTNPKKKTTLKRPLTNAHPSKDGKRQAKGMNLVNTKNGTTVFTPRRAIMDTENTTLTKQVAMDCEMVGIGDGTESMLARVSLVNRYGGCLYDKYVKPREIVKDYRTAVSGIRPHHIRNGEDFETVQAEVAEILKGRILVGHALQNDLSVLFLSHPRRFLRDTSRYKLFRSVAKGSTPSLKRLATELLGIDIQTGEHNSVEDARAAMELYVLYKHRWESDLHR